MKIDAGALDRQLLIEAATKTRDAAGQTVETWSTLATIRGQRLALRQNQKAEARPTAVDKGPGIALVATARYLVRWRSDLQIGMRVTVDGSIMFIDAIEQPDRRQTVILTISQ